MSKKRQFPPPLGWCNICGKFDILEEEHIPPQKAYNFSRYALQAFDSSSIVMLETRQGGVRFFSLCKQCNNNTGAWYGGEFVEWARGMNEIYGRLDISARTLTLKLYDCRPLHFLKQVLTIFYSVNHKGIAQQFPDLKDFILDRYNQSCPPKYKVYMFAYRDNVPFHVVNEGLGGIVGKNTYVFRHYPFGFFLTEGIDEEFDLKLNGEKLPLQQITWFVRYKYDEQADIGLNLSVLKHRDFPNPKMIQEQLIQLPPL